VCIYIYIYTWFKFNAIVIVVIIVRALRDIGRERRIAAFHSSLRLPLARLNAVFLHSRWPVDAMQLEIKAAGVAHRFTLCVTTP